MNNNGVVWKIKIVPDERYIEKLTTSFPLLFLIAGLILSILVAWVFYLLILSRSRSEKIKRNAELLTVIYKSVQSILDSTSVNQTIKRLLANIAETMHWPIGHAYKYDKKKNMLRSTGIWYIEPSKEKEFKPFVDVTQTIDFEKGVGLPGRVWEEETPAWIDDIHKDNNVPRAVLCRDTNLHNAFAFPIFTKEKQINIVLEFFAESKTRKDKEFIRILNLLSVQVNSALYRLSIERQIKESKEQISLLLSSAGEGIYGLDLEGKTTFANPAALEMLGYTYDEVLGQSMHTLVHYSYPDGSTYLREDCPMYAAFTDGEIHRVSGEVLWRKDGSAFPVEYTSTPIRREGKLYGAVVIFKDVTQETEQRQQIEFNHELMDELVKIQEHYISGRNPQHLFSQTLSILMRLSASQYGFIGDVLKDDHGIPYLKFSTIQSIGWSEEEANKLERDLVQGIECSDLETLIGGTLREGKLINARKPKEKLSDCEELLNHPVVNNYIGVPVFGKQGLIGVVGLMNRKKLYNKAIMESIDPIIKSLSSIMDANIASQQLELMVHHDALTGLHNRAFFNEYLQKTLAIAKRRNTIFALLYIDLDDFKKVNDTLGHPAADKLLQHVSERLLRISRESDMVARLGGDEFIVILSDINSPQEAVNMASMMIQAIQKPFRIDASNVAANISIGVAIFPFAGKTAEGLFKCTDIALYKAKNAGKNQYQLYKEEVKQEHSRHLLVEESLKKALLNKEFFLEYQPQWDLKTNKIMGMEALLRWKNEELGIIYPDEFIYLLEDTNKIREVGAWVIDAAFKQLSEIKSLLPKGFVMSVNLSGKQINDANLVHHIKKMLSTYRLEAGQIDFEVTESCVMSVDRAEPILDALSHIGFSISIDDFGTGYSSLSRLQDFPIDTLKIDKSFVVSLSNRDESKLIIENTLHLAKNLKLKVIAEGIETHEQLQFLIDQKCPYGQGFYLAKPMSIEGVKKILKK